VSSFERVMTRCRTCKNWWSVGPHDEPKCPCGGELVPVDMKAHIASLPDGTKIAGHNHLTKEPRPPGQCEACDRDYLAKREAEKAAKAKADPQSGKG
jgi:hypothetical protein